MGIFWEFHQQQQIWEAESAARGAKLEVSAYAHRLREVEQQLARVTLVSQALWELLRERTGITEEQLVSKVVEVDLRDGQLDDRIAARTMPCPQCKRMLNSKNVRCIYCGAGVPKDYAFQ